MPWTWWIKVENLISPPYISYFSTHISWFARCVECGSHPLLSIRKTLPPSRIGWHISTWPCDASTHCICIKFSQTQGMRSEKYQLSFWIIIRLFARSDVSPMTCSVHNFSYTQLNDKVDIFIHSNRSTKCSQFQLQSSMMLLWEAAADEESFDWQQTNLHDVLNQSGEQRQFSDVCVNLILDVHWIATHVVTKIKT